MVQGYRTDLRDEDNSLDDREDIEFHALCLAKLNFGTTAWEVARGMCSKEWVRKILNQLKDDGLLFIYDIKMQLHLFRITEAGEQKLQELTAARKERK